MPPFEAVGGSCRVMSAVSIPDRTPALLTADEVAAICRVNPRTVRRWGESGLLERVQLGARLTRYTEASLFALIAPGRPVEAEPEPVSAPGKWPTHQANNGEDPADNRIFAKERDDGAHHGP